LLARAVPKIQRSGGLQVSPDGTLLAIGANTDDGSASLWFLGGPEVRELDLPRPGVNRLWLDLPDHVITQDVQGPLLEVFSASALDGAGVELGNLNNTNLAVSPNGEIVALMTSAPDDLLLHVVEIATGRQVTPPIDLRLIHPDLDAPHGVAFNADGTQLLASTRNGAAATFDTQTWQLIDVVAGGAGIILDIAYSRDGSYLATSDSTGAITLRDATTNQPLGRQLIGSTAGLTTAEVRPLTFSSDSRYILTTADGTARMWDRETAVLVGAPITQSERSNITLSNNGRWLPVERERHILVYDLDVTRWFDVACRAAGRNLTVAEWKQFGPSDSDPQQTCRQWAPPEEPEEAE